MLKYRNWVKSSKLVCNLGFINLYDDKTISIAIYSIIVGVMFYAHHVFPVWGIDFVPHNHKFVKSLSLFCFTFFVSE